MYGDVSLTSPSRYKTASVPVALDSVLSFHFLPISSSIGY